jgi:choline-sulfatase
MQALKESGLADNTVVMLTADHGDMLGERGLWYKMTWFENACRIPLIVSAPGKFKPGRIATNASHLDLLPTLAEIANEGGAFRPAAEIDGKSLLGALSGGTGHDEAIGEYCGEGAIAPLVMIRRGNLKFVHTPSDPDQLYDLKADPLEKQNLAADPKHAATVEAFRKEVKQRWDLAKLKDQVIDSQRRRRIVYEALAKGRHRSWDYQPIRDAGTAYMRNHVVLDDLEARTRLPRVG